MHRLANERECYVIVFRLAIIQFVSAFSLIVTFTRAFRITNKILNQKLLSAFQASINSQVYAHDTMQFLMSKLMANLRCILSISEIDIDAADAAAVAVPAGQALTVTWRRPRAHIHTAAARQ